MRALVFDFDGLVVDTESPEFESWQQIFTAHGQLLDIQSWAHIVGSLTVMDPRQELEGRLGRRLDWESLDQVRRTHYQELSAATKALPGVEALMRQGEAQGWKIGVASSSTVAWVEGGLKRLGLLPYVKTIRGRDRVTHLKPHPEPYLKALEDLGASAAESFAFEDSQIGVAAAKAAGLHVVAVPNALTRYHDLSAADEILESLEAFALPENF